MPGCTIECKHVAIACNLALMPRLAELMEFAAFIYLRYTAPSLFRYIQAGKRTYTECKLAAVAVQA